MVSGSHGVLKNKEKLYHGKMLGGWWGLGWVVRCMVSGSFWVFAHKKNDIMGKCRVSGGV